MRIVNKALTTINPPGGHALGNVYSVVRCALCVVRCALCVLCGLCVQLLQPNNKCVGQPKTVPTQTESNNTCLFVPDRCNCQDNGENVTNKMIF